MFVLKKFWTFEKKITAQDEFHNFASNDANEQMRQWEIFYYFFDVLSFFLYQFFIEISY